MVRPRVLIAAPASGSGKTMITCGILRALVRRGIKVSSFKCGPDYIDPMFHEKVIGTTSGNLDLFFAKAPLMRRLFCRNSENTDFSVIEGVMGYYDGMGASTDEASSFRVAEALDAPVILIVNARGQSISALATLSGFMNFRENSRIKAVIFNQMSEHVFNSLKDEVSKLGVIPLGFVPKSDDLVIESRHLGLVTPGEIEGLTDRLDSLAQLLEKTVDIDGLIALGKSAEKLTPGDIVLPKPCEEVVIAAAKDEAFCFYYKDNLDLLQRLGAKIVYFSPIHDKALPEGTEGLLLPGGYPELYAESLAGNTAMRKAVHDAVTGGMPCLAECGGFMYLHREIEDMNGKFWPMAGVLNAKAYRTNRLGRFGYITLTGEKDSDVIQKGGTVCGHEFHYFESESCGEDMTATKPITGKSWRCVHAEGGLLAGFPHLFYYSNPDLAVRFLRACAGKEKS